MPDAIALFRFDALPAPIALEGCAELVEPIAARLNGWKVTPWNGAPAPAPAITVSRDGKDFVLRSDYIKGEEIYGNLSHLVCAFLVEMIVAYGEARPGHLFIHAGAVAPDERLVVFPAEGRTGKSTLTAQLARRGARVFSDDVVAVDLATGLGEALGIEPRLRLPLSSSLSAETRAWIARHTALPARKMCYLSLPREGPGALAPRGEQRPIGAFVQLVREEGAKPEIAPCPRADIMRLLIVQHFRTRAPTPQVVERFAELVKTVPCYRLRYGGGEAAADLLTTLTVAA